jgi:peptidoglycan hydrolase-like protein with peptidoglycan-binding domain
MKEEAMGPDVVQVQLALKEKGFLLGRADGLFGTVTELGVKFFQVRAGLKATGVVEQETYSALGIDLQKR